jgi:hypothetical protein
MKLEQLSSEAGQAAREAVRLVQRPGIAAIRRSRTRRTGVAAVLSAAVIVGVVAFWPGAAGTQSTGPADEPGPPATTTTLPPSTTAPPVLINPVVTTLPPGERVPLRILAVRPNNPSLAVVDLEAGTTTVYAPGAHTLPLDAVDGAVMTPDRETVIWTSGVARLFPGPFDRIGIELGPVQVRLLSGFAPSLRVVPTPDGNRAWVVQPGIAQRAQPQPTLIELVELPTGRVIQSYEADANAFPIAATDTGLVLNTERLFDTGDGWTTEPGSERVLHLLEDGTTVDAGPGRAIAAGADIIIRLACDKPNCDPWSTNTLVFSSPDGSDRRIIVAPSPGVWRPVGGPTIPSDAMPLQTVSPDGSTVLIGRGQALDVNNTPAESQVVAIDLVTGSSTVVATFGGAPPVATWSADGEWVALLSGRDVRLVNLSDPAKNFILPDAIPLNHFVFAAG